MIIPKVHLINKDIPSVIEVLNKLEKHSISHPNWVKYADYPIVTFQAGHDGENLYLKYDVQEKEIRAMAKENNSQVCEDSCVEFFVSFKGSDYYYNLEQSCIGVTLLAYRKERKNSTRASDEIINSITRWSSLGNENFELKQGSFNWTLVSIIPVETFWGSKLKSFDGIKAKANFYKCGDKLTHRHYLSWKPIEIEIPNFHRVDFFQEIIFE